MSTLAFKDRVFYGWIIVANFFIIGTAIWGVRYSFGVFFKSIETEFSLGRAATSAIFSTQMVLSALFTVLSGWALDRYGPKIVISLMGFFIGCGLLLTSQAGSLWQLFITYSLFLAMGTSAIYVVVMSTVVRWFDRKRGMALGIASAGGGLGPILMAPLATLMITSFDWRTAYIIIGIAAWVIILPLSRLLKRDPQEIGALPDGAVMETGERGEGLPWNISLSLSQAIRTRSFWLVVSVFFLFAFNLFLILTHLVPHGTDTGLTQAEAALVLSVAGGATLVSRLFLGVASDKLGRKKAAATCMLLNAAAMVWLLYSRDLWAFYVFGIVFGLAWGGMAPAMAALIGDTFGVGNMGAILGVLDTGFSVGAAVGPLVGGYIYDVSHSYFIAFLLAAVVMLAAAVLITLVRRETDGRRQPG